MPITSTHKIFVVVGEPSGDQLGAQLVTALRSARTEHLSIHGVGGPKMKAIGVSSIVDITPLAVIGPIDGLRVYPKVRKIVAQTVQQINEFQPDIVVLIDAWGFTLRVAQAVRKILPDCVLVKYVGPQVFASRPKRARTTAQVYDHLLTIHSFDAPFFEAQGLPTSFVGNPTLFENKVGDSTGFRKKYQLQDQPVLCVLFGSRNSEILHLMEPFLAALAQLKTKFPKLIMMAPLSDNIATRVRSMAASDSRLQDIILLPEEEKNNVFAVSDCALACSGTVTLQLARAGVPMIVAYRFGAISNWLLRHIVFKAKFANLLNLSMDEEIIPELLLENCTASSIYAALELILSNPDIQAIQKKKMAIAINQMRGTTKNASGAAAQQVLQLLDQRPAIEV